MADEKWKLVSSVTSTNVFCVRRKVWVTKKKPQTDEKNPASIVEERDGVLFGKSL